MPGGLRVERVRFPAALVSACPGCALDIGGSAVKIIYRSQEDWDEAERDEAGAHLHLLTCGRGELEAALERVSASVRLSRDATGSPATVFSCGLGGYQWHGRLEAALGTRIENLLENDRLFAGLEHFLQQLAQEDLAHPQDDRQLRHGLTDGRVWLEQQAGRQGAPLRLSASELRPYPPAPALSPTRTMLDVLGSSFYPFIFLNMGSVYGCLQMNASGPPRALEICKRAGRTFLALASLLTGIESYEEFIDLAEAGDERAVSEMMSGEDSPVWQFLGRADPDLQERCQKADVARAWLCTHIDDVTSWVHRLVALTGVGRVVVGGGFASRSLVRAEMSRSLARADCKAAAAHGKQFHPTIHFLKYGGHLCAFGALLYGIKQDTPERQSDGRKN